jgi:DNA polymerase-3 subunit beta
MATEAVERGTSLKAVVKRRDLTEGVQTVARAVSGRSALPILGHVLVRSRDGQLDLIATDLELAITTSIPAQVQEDGALTAPAKLITELLSSLSEGEIAVSVDRSHAVRVNAGRSDYKLNGLPAEEYPKLTAVQEVFHIRMAQPVLREMIRQVLFAVSRDEARAILTGVLAVLEDTTLRLVATDTHRLAVREHTVEEAGGSGQAIIPSRAMNELLHLLEDEGEVEIVVGERDARFLLSHGVELTTRLIEGQFPNYSRVIPTGFQTSFTVEAGPFQSALRRAELVARSASHRVILSGSPDTLVITAESSTDGSAREEVELALEGERIEVAFNVRYLLDMLAVVDSPGIRIELSDPLKPGLIKPSGTNPDAVEDYLCVLMPMQMPAM